MCIYSMVKEKKSPNFPRHERKKKMKKHKRPFEDYEEVALNIRTAQELLRWMQHIYGRAWLHERIQKLCWNLDKIVIKLENEMFEDYPELANTNVFYGGGKYDMQIRKHRDYIYSRFADKKCSEDRENE